MRYVFMGRGAAPGMDICSENGLVGRVGNPPYVLIGRGAAPGMAICSENRRRVTQDAILRYVFIGRGAAPGMVISSEVSAEASLAHEFLAGRMSRTRHG